MATAQVVSQDSTKLFFCHSCSQEVYPKLPVSKFFETLCSRKAFEKYQYGVNILCNPTVVCLCKTYQIVGNDGFL